MNVYGFVCLVRVFGVCQLELEQSWCGGWSCDGGRRAALDVAVDIGVRVRLNGVESWKGEGRYVGGVVILMLRTVTLVCVFGLCVWRVSA